MVGVLVGSIALLADFFLRFTFWGGAGGAAGGIADSGGGGLQASSSSSALVLAILAPIAARLVQMAVSRQREYLADASGVELTRNPYGLERALAKIALDTEPLEVANRATQHLYFENPIKELRGRSRSLFSTHPPALDRINRLRELTGAAAGAADALPGAGPGRAGCARCGAAPRRAGRVSPARLPPLRGPCYSPARRRAPAGTRDRAEIAQLVEHATENRGVASSNLALGTIPGCGHRAEVAQLVEHHLAKVRVAGSSPVFRSTPPRHDVIVARHPLPLRLVVGQRTLDPLAEVRILEGQPSHPGRWSGSMPRRAVHRTYRQNAGGSGPRGDVVKWLNTEVCKTSIHRFESDRRLQPSTNWGPGHTAWGLRRLSRGRIGRRTSRRPRARRGRLPDCTTLRWRTPARRDVFLGSVIRRLLSNLVTRDQGRRHVAGVPPFAGGRTEWRRLVPTRQPAPTSAPPRDEIGVRLSREPGVAQRLHRSRLAYLDRIGLGGRRCSVATLNPVGVVSAALADGAIGFGVSIDPNPATWRACCSWGARRPWPMRGSWCR